MISGFLVVDKPQGITSHQVVARARRVLSERKIGHAGTLDPMATGVMLLGAGRGTRLLGHLTLADKTYEATIRLGASTITDDAEGEVISAPGAAGLDQTLLGAEIERLTGEIEQVPSAVSAIKVDGQRSYARVRAGEDVELKERQVTVTRFDVLDVRHEGAFCDVDVDVECSSGTYIRALARDLGASLGVGGHLTMLRRVRVGGFTLDGALAPAQLTDDATAIALPPLGESAAAAFASVTAPDELLPRILVGQTVPLVVPADPTAVLTTDGRLLGLYRPAPDAPGSFAKPVAILA